jgi:hypothetical protein
MVSDLLQAGSQLLILFIAPVLCRRHQQVKSIVAGRKGPPVLQLYYDIFKLGKRGATYSRSTSPPLQARTACNPCRDDLCRNGFSACRQCACEFPGDAILFVTSGVWCRF